jgi:hypothetical protein
MSRIELSSPMAAPGSEDPGTVAAEWLDEVCDMTCGILGCSYNDVLTAAVKKIVEEETWGALLRNERFMEVVRAAVQGSIDGWLAEKE